MSPKDKRSLEESSVTAAATAANAASTSTSTATISKEAYQQDGAEARKIAHYLPYFPFKGIPRFYDIGGFLYEPAVFRRIVDIFVHRYREIGVDVIAGCVCYFTCSITSLHVSCSVLVAHVSIEKPFFSPRYLSDGLLYS